MKKLTIPAFILVIGAMVLISAWPSIVESRKPVNMFIAKVKATGALPVIQMVNTAEEAEIAEAEINKFNNISPRIKLAVGIFSASENGDTVHQYNMQVPGFVIFDADGNLAVQEAGLPNSARLIQMTTDVHTH